MSRAIVSRHADAETCVTRVRVNRILGLVAVLFICLLAFAASFLPSEKAIAATSRTSSDYMGDIVIDATLDENGVMHVVEQRTTTKLSTRDFFKWTLPGYMTLDDGRFELEGDAPISIDDEAGHHDLSYKIATLGRYSYATKGTAYTYDLVPAKKSSEGFDAIYIFDPQNSGGEKRTMLITIRYQVTGAVKLHSDVAELDWQCVSRNWKRPARKLDATVTLPGLATGTGADGVSAWNIGGTSDNVEVGSNGTNSTVSLSINGLPAETAQSLHVTMPATWLANSDLVSDGEEAYAAIAEQQRKKSGIKNVPELVAGTLTALGIIVVVAALAVLIGLSYRFNYRGELGKRSKDVKPRGVLPSNDNPAFLAYLFHASKGREWYYWGQLAAFIDLVRQGALKPVKGSKTRFSLVDPDLSDGIDFDFEPGDTLAKTNYSYVASLAGDDGVFDLSDLKRESEENPRVYVDFSKSWAKSVEDSSYTEKYHIADCMKEARMLALFSVAILAVTVIVSFIYAVNCAPNFDGAIAAFIGTAFCIACGLFVYSRRNNAFMANQEGCDLLDRCDAFAQWFETSQATMEMDALPDDLRNRYLAVGTAFGLKKRNERTRDEGDRDAQHDPAQRRYNQGGYYYDTNMGADDARASGDGASRNLFSVDDLSAPSAVAAGVIGAGVAGAAATGIAAAVESLHNDSALTTSQLNDFYSSAHTAIQPVTTGGGWFGGGCGGGGGGCGGGGCGGGCGGCGG